MLNRKGSVPFGSAFSYAITRQPASLNSSTMEYNFTASLMFYIRFIFVIDMQSCSSYTSATNA